MDVGEGLQVVSGGLCARVGGGAKCGRWNPTAEQVKVLTDLFRAGLRTPSAEQIQTISSHLSSFGKIESKNVFYWFQNHKARERHQKKRRRGGAGEAFCMLTPSKREALNMMAGGQQVSWEPQEKEVETLELFPLKSYDSEVEEVTARMECKEILGLDNGRDPPLDLRLSFL